MKPSLRLSLILVSLVFVGAGLYLWNQTRSFVAFAVLTDGEVSAIRTMKSGSAGRGRSGTVERPVVEYTSPDGRGLEFIPKVGRHDSNFRVGQSLQLYVDPEDPAHVVLDSFNTLWLPSLLLVGIGLLLLAVTCLLGRIMPASPP